eukprot:9407830-Pyramimonas_sp.AAC.1
MCSWPMLAVSREAPLLLSWRCSSWSHNDFRARAVCFSCALPDSTILVEQQRPRGERARTGREDFSVC